MDSQDKDDKLKKYWKVYLYALRSNPVRTKAVSSGIIGMIGNITAQLINLYRGEMDEISFSAIGRYGAFGLLITGPLVHYFYKWLDEKYPPSKEREVAIKRFFIERLVLAPLFSVVFHAFMSGLEYQSVAPTILTVRALFWPTLLMNWKYWTVLQFIIINYVPRDLRPLFGSLCGLLWNIALSAGLFQQ